MVLTTPKMKTLAIRFWVTKDTFAVLVAGQLQRRLLNLEMKTITAIEKNLMVDLSVPVYLIFWIS